VLTAISEDSHGALAKNDESVNIQLQRADEAYAAAWGLRSGELDGEFGTFTQTAVDLDAAAHLFDGVFDDGKPQPGTAHGARARFIGTIKALEDAGKVFGRDADARISYENADSAVARAHLHLDFAVGAVELHGVIQ
jgi:hypothetical protein